ncbi:PREDICTED: thrombomodulin [Galeopterus variegatus]|uniref:Thrombomodulin n=1 Tax=Galeopterus variegatus TaxID=482537 RepID=A0ABM0RZH6_GALVR|nr:PREDICTED: thrombomodulin [Galeopterus variegatus]
MLRVLLLGVLARAGLGLPATPEPQPSGSQCVEHDCFALFRGRATFLAASQACERLRGHLMTVRSSVAADVISLLLSDDGGDGLRLWIGLHLAQGCGDPGHLGPLRGFQWVTGDNSTSYSRWARLDRDGAPLCGPLCVTVSAAGTPAPGEPAWQEQQCDAEEARWGRVAPGAWDCSVERGGCEHSCNQSAGAPRCLCPADAALQADGRSCATPAVHLCDSLCEHLCFPDPDVPGSYSCMCEAGYQLAADGHRCEDVDDCTLVPSPCPQLCVNMEGGFECHCRSGFELVDGECVEPVDPCLGADCEYQCQPMGQTHYQCVCAEGFAPIPNEPHKCQMFCNQTACPADCDPNTPGRCQCPDGYILDEGFMCTDIDECNHGGYCSHECRNLPGTFECICRPDSAVAVQVGRDCDSTEVNTEDDGGSGELPASPMPRSTASPPSSEPVHSGVLIGTSIACLSLVVALLALLCHLRKKQGSARAELEYKSAAPAVEEVLQHVRTERTLQKL